GAAAGAPGSAEDVTGPIVIRKHFEIARGFPLAAIESAALEIRLYEAPANLTPLLLALSRHERIVQPGTGERGKYQWRSFDVDPRTLRAGLNTVTLRTAAPTDTSAWAVLLRRSAY